MGSRGVTNVVGISLLFGFIGVTAIGMIVVGTMAVDSVQNDAEVEQAEDSLVTFADSVSNGQSASLSVPNSGETQVRKESSIVVEMGSNEILDASLGTIVYEQDGRQRVFEGGAVFAAQDEHTTVVRQPTISYQYDGANRDQTLVVDAVQVSGSLNDLETASPLEQRAVGTDASRGAVDEPVTVEIESEYADAWARYFRERTRANVDFDENAGVVRATFPVQDPRTVDNSFTVDGSLSLGGNIEVDSYDSTNASGSGSIGLGNYQRTGNGDVVATENFGGHGGMTVHGDLYVNNSFRWDGGTDVQGSVYASDDVEIATNRVEDSVVSGGDVVVDGGGVVFEEYSEVRAAGAFVDDNSDTYEGRIHAGESIDADGGWSTIEDTAEFVAGDTVSVDPSPDPSQVSEHATAPSTDELSRIDEAVDSIPNPSERVTTAFDHYGSAPDPGIGGENANDSLTAGIYRLNRNLEYGGNSDLELDTSGGDVVLLIDGDVDAKNLDAEVTGDGQVHIYVRGNFRSGGNPEWSNPDGAGDRLFVYTSDSAATTYLASDFYGVVFSESDLDLGGSATIYGGVVMEGSSLSGGQAVYFDEALSGADIGIGDGGNGSEARQTYLHVSQTTVEES